MNNKEELQKALRYTFLDKSLLNHALKHKSVVGKNHNESNERMEFLGDAVLQLAISTYLYQQYPLMPEGKLAKLRASLVCQATLAEIAKDLNIGDALCLGKGEKVSKGDEKPSILSDAMEAVLAAIYLDSDYDTVYQVILRIFVPVLMEQGVELMDTDHKTKLQELLQKDGNVKIEYVVTKESGLPHDMCFSVDVQLDGKTIGTGKGKSKKNAEQSAAKDALSKIK